MSTRRHYKKLLAVRLTDGTESDAASVRLVLATALSEVGPAIATALTEYYDVQIRLLVERLESEAPKILTQIRSEAFSVRIVAVLNAIERHTAALAVRPGRDVEDDFLARYRRHVRDQHGKLEPPDFDRRRRVPAEDIYVPAIVSADLSSAQAPVAPVELADLIDRTVLLGDPGSGKTTAANMLMHYFACDPNRPVPFLVTLRNFASKDPPERSVAAHIEHTLETFYQCSAPAGLVYLLLLSGRATVIFDGLDELLDTSRRRDVSDRVERFCAEYPLTKVLVTSRLVGYDQARLDDGQFGSLRLGGFGGPEVEAYVHKWFALDGGHPGDAQAFLEESESVPDLRTNPLLLSLMCILYRGRGSLPRHRAEVYGQCADLLYRKWDERRRIYAELRAGSVLEPTLRHLAWWLFTRDSTHPVVTEGALIASTARFLHGTRFESQEEARDAAQEFVGFCRGRKWVFSDAGTTAEGERLYGFTHRTFGEYFAAAHLAYDSDSAEHLATTLAPRVANGEWAVIAELAIQIKDGTSTHGAARIYDILLAGRRRWSRQERARLLGFLAQGLRSMDPSPRVVRNLSREILQQALESHAQFTLQPLHELFTNCGAYRETAARELDALIEHNVRFGSLGERNDTLRFVAAMLLTLSPTQTRPDEFEFWESCRNDILRKHATAVTAIARDDAYVHQVALGVGVIPTGKPLQIPGGLGAMFQNPKTFFPDITVAPALERAFRALLTGWPAYGFSPVIDDLEMVGEYLVQHPTPPWLSGPIGNWLRHPLEPGLSSPANTPCSTLTPTALLGAAALTAILAEKQEPTWPNGKSSMIDPEPLLNLLPYLRRRQGTEAPSKLPRLSLPLGFDRLFREWAEGRIVFTRW